MDTDRDQTFAAAPRIVKPRRSTHARLPVVAIHDHETLMEDGTFGTLEELVAALPTMPATLFVKYNAADFVAALDLTYRKTYPSWQWHASERERAITDHEGRRVASRVTVAIHFFGFKNRNYHKIIDPVTLHARSLDEIQPGPEPKIVRLLQWAILLRDFCDENGLQVRPTAGGIAAQFLTDKRFYPNARRKVPHRTNDTVREEMPGNFYHLTVRPGPEREYTAWYLDQRRAHHHHAQALALPASDGLYAHGHFYDCAEIAFTNTWDDFCGLYCLDLTVPHDRPPNRIMQAWLRHFPQESLLEKRYVYSNELPLLRNMGYTVHGVRAAWGSHRRDTGLSHYAEWACSQLDRYEDAPWLKPLLLSAYGTLATRPKIAEAIWRTARKGEPITLAVGKNKLHGMVTRGRFPLEPRIANVLHRGMIEAATRAESVSYAIHLKLRGYKVLCIYADAVIVEVDDDHDDLPLIIDPWRLKNTLHHLQFINTQSFQSGEMTRLPGVPGGSRDALRHRQATPGHAPRVKIV